MSCWKWDGYKPIDHITVHTAFELADEEVLELMRAGTINIRGESPDQLPALRVWQRLQRRAEDILNEERAPRYIPRDRPPSELPSVPTDLALEVDPGDCCQ